MSPGRFRDLAPVLRARVAQGVSMSDALTELKGEQVNALEVLKALRELTGVGSREAAEMLRAVPVWRESVERVYRSTDEFFGGQP